jgi:Tfp pilus assembly protein PilO
LLGRVAREKRAVLIPLALGLVVNIALSAVVVFPLSRRVQSAEGMEAQANRVLRSAELDQAAASLVLERKVRAESDLSRFYTQVLPADLSAARRQTYVRLAQLARAADLQYQRRLEEVQPPRTTGSGPVAVLTRYEIAMVLRGEYDSVRQFIRDVEASQEFLSIEDVSLAAGTEPGSPLVLTLVMATYYRAGRDGG